MKECSVDNNSPDNQARRMSNMHNPRNFFGQG